MKELDVVVDLRQSPDSPDLIVVRQKVQAKGDELHFVGDPFETRLSMAARKANVGVSMRVDNEVGYVLVAKIKNIGFTPFAVSKVDFSFDYINLKEFETRVAGKKYPLAATSYGLVPADRRQTGPLVPGEIRDWYLPMEFLGQVVESARDEPPERYALVAFSGDQEVGRLGGEFIQPFLEHAPPVPTVNFGNQTKSAFEALPEEAKEFFMSTAKKLLATPRIHWRHVGNVAVVQLAPGTPDEAAKDLYIVKANDMVSFLVRYSAVRGIDVVDVIHGANWKEASQPSDAAAG